MLNETDYDGDLRVLAGRIDIGADEWLDTDSDTLPDWWETKYFGSPTDANPDNDPDEDRLTNLQEYEEYGTNPVAAPFYVDGTSGDDAWDGKAAVHPTDPPGNMIGPKRTIQAGIDAATDADTVLVAPGAYTGTGNKELDYRGKGLVIRASDAPGPTVTRIDCQGSGRAVNFASASAIRSVLEGFSIINGSSNVGAGIKGAANGLYLANCQVHDNAASQQAGGISSSGALTVKDLTLGENNTAPAGSVGVLKGSLDLHGDLILDFDSLLGLRTLQTAVTFDGPGAIRVGPLAMLQVTGNTTLRSNLTGTGYVTIDPGDTLTVAGQGCIDMRTPDSGEACVDDGGEAGGRIIIEGALLARDQARVQNAIIEVREAQITSDEPVHNNDITLIDSLRSGGEFFVAGWARILGNVITSKGDRYLDLDPDPAVEQHPVFQNNRITVQIETDPAYKRGTLLELRARDDDCGTAVNPDCASGHFQTTVSGRFTGENAENWVLEKLEILPGAKLTLTNRPGFRYQPGFDPPETVYVKELILHNGTDGEHPTTLNTGLQTLYYESLKDESGNTLDPQNPAGNREIVDEPLLGFSLGIIGMDDDTLYPHNEFDVRIDSRHRDPGDDQATARTNGSNPNSCKEGSIVRLPAGQVVQEIPGLNQVGGVMDMRTQAIDPQTGQPNRQPASSVAAKGAFARAGDESIVITFDYLFREAPPGTKMNVYLSDKRDQGDHIIKVAEVYPPTAGGPGGVGGTQFALFQGRFPRQGVSQGQGYELNFTRGTYVELELVAGRDGGNQPLPARVWIDNFDPQVWCDTACGSFDGDGGPSQGDYLALLAELNQTLPANKYCLDLNDDGYVDLADAFRWELIAVDDSIGCRVTRGPCCLSDGTCADGLTSSECDAEGGTWHGPGGMCNGNPPPCGGTGSVTQKSEANVTSTEAGDFLVLGRSSSTDENAASLMYPVNWSSGVPAALGGEAITCGGLPNCRMAASRLVRDDQDRLCLVHGKNGIIVQATGTILAGAKSVFYPEADAMVRVGINEAGENALLDAAFDPAQPGYVYVVPVEVTPTGRSYSYRAAAKLTLTVDSFEVAQLYGLDPYDSATRELPGMECLNVVPTAGYARPQCDFSGVREIEVDGQDNVYVAAGSSYNDGNWLLIYGDDGTSLARINLADSAYHNAYYGPVNSPSAMLFSQTPAQTGNRGSLYLTSAAGSHNGLMAHVYRFDVSVTGDAVTWVGALAIDGNAALPSLDICNDNICDGYSSGATAILERPDGSLYVFGYTSPAFSENQTLKPLKPDGELHSVFTTPTLAQILPTTPWSQTQSGATSVPAYRIAGSSLALPISAASAAPDLTLARSRKDHGSTGSFDINVLTPGAVEGRTGGPTQIVATFDKRIQITLGTASVTLSSGTVSALTVGGTELTIHMSGATSGAPLTVGFPGIADATEASWVTSSTMCFGVLVGDVNQDRSSNIFDSVAIRTVGLNTAANSTSFRMDVDADGMISIFDLVAVRNHMNQNVPACP